MTDDRGRYRLWGLLPGTYVVEASGGSSLATGAEMVSADGATVRQVTRAPVYAPGAPRAIDALQITVGVGEERTGVDIVNPLVPSSKLALRVIGDAGQPLQNVSIGIASLTLGRVSYSPGVLRPDAEGRFTMPSLVPGRYLFYGSGRAAPTGTTDRPLWLRTEVEVGAADTDATLSLKRGQRVSGRVTADDVPPAWPAAALRLVALPEIAGTAIPVGEARPAEDGSFEFPDVPPGRYALELSVPGGWKLESAVREGKDILDVLLDVAEGSDVAGIAARVSRRATRVSGLVVDSLGRPSPEFSVVVFPADSELRRTAARRTSGLIKIGSDGRFTIDHLPPGDYLLAVVVDGDPDQLKDGGFLDLVAQGAIPIRLAPGATIEQTLKIGGS